MYSSKRFGYVARRTGAVVLLAALLGSSGVALAQQPAPRLPVPPPAIPSAMQFFHIYPGLTFDRQLEGLRLDFLQIDADEDGSLTQRDVDLHTQMETLQVRAFGLHFVMRFDLDGDNAVTEDEIRRAMRYEQRFQPSRPRRYPTRRKSIADTVRSIMALDTDKDGKVSCFGSQQIRLSPACCALGWARNRNARAMPWRLSAVRRAKSRWRIIRRPGAALFRKINSDNDGVISQQELTDYRQRPDTPEGAAYIAAAELVQKRQRERDEAVRKRQQEAEAARAGCADAKSVGKGQGHHF